MTDRYIDKCCRYYRGEETNPYSREEGWLWECERDYCAYCSLEDSSSLLDRCIDSYTSAGLGSFRRTDGVSISLKAFLYSCYARRATYADTKGFKEWYSWYY